MKVLSLCDGMSCGQIALRQLMLLNGFENLRVEKYYASEIDKHAIDQTQYNFPDTVQLGDIVFLRRAVCFSERTAQMFLASPWINEEKKACFRYLRYGIDWKSIDLILGGTPCQGFSFAGKQLAFNDPRSRLFFEFCHILKHIQKLNPRVKFLLENVNMAKKHLRIISEYVGVFPVNINSALVSAQNRNRWYWTDIRTRQEGFFGEVYSDIPQPQDRGIMLRDILEPSVDEKYYLSEKSVQKLFQHKERNDAAGNGFGKTFHDPDGKMSALKVVEAGSDDLVMIQLPRGYNKGGLHEEKAPTLSANSWERNNMIIQLNGSKESGGIQPYQQNRVYNPAGKSPALIADMSCGTHAILEKNGISVLGNIYDNGHNSQAGRVYGSNGKATALRGEAGGVGSKTGLYLSGSRIRRLTPTECARLQTVPENYKWACSETQQYRMLGNGWTIGVIKHILSCGKWKR